MSILPFIHKEWAKIVDIAAKHQMTNLRLIGSVARGQDNPQSDVDFMAEPAEGSKCSLFEIGNLEKELGAFIGREVDICTPKGFHWYAFAIDPDDNPVKRRKIKFDTLAIELVERLDNIRDYSKGWNEELFRSDPLVKDAVLCNMHIIIALARTLPDDIFNRYMWYDRMKTVKNQDPIVMWNTFRVIAEPLKRAILYSLGCKSIEEVRNSVMK